MHVQLYISTKSNMLILLRLLVLFSQQYDGGMNPDKVNFILKTFIGKEINIFNLRCLLCLVWFKHLWILKKSCLLLNDFERGKKVKMYYSFVLLNQPARPFW